MTVMIETQSDVSLYVEPFQRFYQSNLYKSHWTVLQGPASIPGSNLPDSAAILMVSGFPIDNVSVKGTNGFRFQRSAP